ncbi:Transcriptional regulator, LysR family [Bosea sp. LC85]|uniref:LysR family transcriptional regulator n=1 Tax=Bosea sp. LC85 TaxID=1502851 RepID=UPI0004E368B0|nr:LysR family transcriptional regulator [Bosea sp. LC85]KFC64587.1 Transcriptional regulator, LysR family [Bosea sp. LC85]
MPVTLKQLEAFYWTATLGGFTEAAVRLNLAQSTISKRILEIEAVVNGPLFDRTSHALRLTRAGEASLPVATEMLALEVRFREAASGPATFAGPFRFGATELVALTWLPKLVVAMKRTYPNLIPVPEVAASVDLFGKLAANELDLVIGLDPPQTPELTTVPLKEVQLEWVAAPGFGPVEDCIPLRDMAKYPILSQTQGSGLQRLVLDWAVANGLQINRVVQCNSLNVLAGLAASGLGVTFLTASYFGPEIRNGLLRVIKTEPAIPPIRYFAVHRARDLSPLAARVAEIAQECCDFSARSLPDREPGS